MYDNDKAYYQNRDRCQNQLQTIRDIAHPYLALIKQKLSAIVINKTRSHPDAVVCLAPIGIRSLGGCCSITLSDSSQDMLGLFALLLCCFTL